MGALDISVVFAVAVAALGCAWAVVVGRHGRLSLARLSGGAIGLVGGSSLLASQITGYSVLVVVAATLAVGHVVRQAAARRAGVLVAAIVLCALGALFGERLGPAWTWVGGDTNSAVAWLGAIAVLASVGMARRLTAERWPARLLSAAGVGLYGAGMVGGLAAGSSRTAIVLPVVGVIVVAEAARVLVVLGLALEVADRSARWRRAGRGIALGRVATWPLLAAGFAAVIAAVTGDLGGAGLLALCVAAVVATLAARVWPVVLGACATVVALAGSTLVSGRAARRVASWLGGQGQFQQEAGRFALADGGLFGRGFGRGAPLRVPVVASDYVAAGIGNELGALGLVAVALGLAVIVGGLCWVAVRAAAPRSRAVAVAAAALVGMQAAVNLAGVAGLAPVTGVGLPLVSRGGVWTLAAAMLIAIGSAQRVTAGSARHRRSHDDPVRRRRRAAAARVSNSCGARVGRAA